MTTQIEGPYQQRVTRKRDGYLMDSPKHGARFMTWWESILYRLFGRVPAE